MRSSDRNLKKIEKRMALKTERRKVISAYTDFTQNGF